MKESEITQKYAKLDSLLKHPSARAISGIFYEKMFWYLIGVLEAADTYEHLDAWTVECITNILDSVELEARIRD